MTQDLIKISRKLSRQVDKLSFAAPVTHVYNPLSYARAPHETYLELYGAPAKKIIFLGMNPGPWGMAQTGVPFGDTTMARDFLKIAGTVKHPKHEHPKRIIQGLDCTRSEVSGTRLWGWVKESWTTPKRFFARHYIANYCPLSFMEEGGRNRTPDKLPANEREPLYAICDDALRATVRVLKPEWVIGVGKFAETRARIALDGVDINITSLLHPSPANPQANKGWAIKATTRLQELGLVKKFVESPLF